MVCAMIEMYYKNVYVGKNPKIGRYVEIGCGLDERSDLKTVIGDNAIIRSHSVIYRGNRIGDDFQTGHGILIRENNVVGDNVSIGSHTVVERENRIGDNVRIHSNCFIPEFVIIEDNVWIGPSTTALNVFHPPCPRFEDCAKSIHIKENAKIGGNVTIGPRVTIGRNSLIGMGSIVTMDIPDDVLAFGCPAKAVKKIDEMECKQGYFETPYEWEAKR